MSTRGTGFVPGLIVFLALVTFFGSLLWLSGRAVLFSPDYRYYFDFDDVVGMRDKAPVYMRGYRVGWTKAVEFRDEVVRVTVDIKKGFRFPEDSRVQIATLNFIGEKAITIEPGESGRPLEPGGVITGQNRDLMSLAAKLLNTAKEKMEAGDLDGIIRKVSASVDGVLEAVAVTRDRLGALDVNMFNRQVQRLGEAGEELRTFMAAAREDTRRVSRAGQESLDRFNQTLEQVDATLLRLESLSGEIGAIARRLNRGEGTAGQLLQNEEFYQSLNATLEELSAFLADIKRNPKKYVKFSIF